jgi:hypothetical protein
MFWVAIATTTCRPTGLNNSSGIAVESDRPATAARSPDTDFVLSVGRAITLFLDLPKLSGKAEQE